MDAFNEILASIFSGCFWGCVVALLFEIVRRLDIKNDILKVQLEKMKTDNNSTGD